MAKLIGSMLLAVTGTIHGCTALVDAPAAEAGPDAASNAAVDDGTYLRQIDPLGGQWKVEQLGTEDFTRYNGWIGFSAGGFLNHGAGCSGGYPAFYQLDGERLRITRIEPIRIGKCMQASAAGRKAAADSERRLTNFLNQAIAWRRPDDRTLVLSAGDGTRAVLRRPAEPHPELAGRWIIQSIGGRRLVTERRPPTVTFNLGSVGAHADCNGMGAPYTSSAPGQISLTGPIVSTAMGCLPEDAAEDALMARALTAAKTFRVESSVLVIAGGPGMVLRRPPPPNRRLAGEYEACGNTLLGGYHEGPITLKIEQRSLRDNAGCSADYEASGPRLTLRAPTGAACTPKAPPFEPGKPVGVGGSISVLAVAPPDGFGFDDQGVLTLRTARGHLTMCRRGSPPPFGN